MYKLLSILLLQSTFLFSQEFYNSNPLVVHRITPDIINNVISQTRQNVAFRMQLDHKLLKDGHQSRLNYFLIVDPFPSYGSELKVQLPKKELDNLDLSEIRSSLDTLMGIELHVQHGVLYDNNSLTVVKSTDQESIISFTFNKSTLPKELKHFGEMTGYVYIEDGVLTKIVVKNSKRFALRGIEVNKFNRTTYFKPVQDKGYLVSGSTLDIVGTYDDSPYEEHLMGTVVSYWNANREEVTFEHGLIKKRVVIDDDSYEVVALDLDRFFPILGKEARKAGFELPKPFGITLVNMFQDTNMHMTSFEIDGLGIDLNKILDGDSTYRSLTYAPLLRADLWVLPFVSFSLILGGTDTNTDVHLVSDSGLSIPNPILPNILPPITVIPPGGALNGSLHTNSVLYGVGATIAGGFDNYFTTIDFQYMVAYTPSKDVTLDMMIITPIVGYTFNDYDTRLFIGAQYQRLAQEITFALDFNDQNGQPHSLSGSVGLRSDEWAGVIGTDYSFSRNWSSNLLYSQGVDRKNVVLGITYRF